MAGGPIGRPSYDPGIDVEGAGTGASGRASGWWIAGLTGLVAFAVRAVYAFTARPVLYPGTDNTWYVEVARSIAEGRWGRVAGRTGTPVWTFRFPPAYPWFLAAGERVLAWVRPLDAARWASVGAGAVAAVVVARLAWRWAAGAPPRLRILVAAVAGGVLAVGPIVAGASTGLMSESLFVTVAAGVLLAVDHLLDDGPGPVWVAVLAGLLVVGSLTRVEGVVILGAPVVAALVVGRRRAVTVARWVVPLAVAVVAVGAWSAFASAESGRPVALTSNGSLQLGANCHSAQYGEAAGSWLSDCLALPPDDLSAHARRVLATPVRRRPDRLEPPAGPDVEAEVARMQVREALDRITSDPVGFLHAVPFRLARAAGVYSTPSQENLAVFEGRDRTWEAVGRWFHLLVILPLVIVAAVGLVARRAEVGRRVRRLVDPARVVPAAALFAVWVAGTVVTYGNARLRSPVEPVLALLAGLGAGVLAMRTPAAAPDGTWSG